MAVYQLYKEQKLPASIDDVWGFISSPKNLQRITPSYMGFNISSKDLPEKIFTGLMISYKVSPLFNIKMNWITEITQVKEMESFFDEQHRGPYKIWKHEHYISPIEGGVLMKDRVTYQLPYGILGEIAHSLLVRKKIVEIFDFRENALTEIFGDFN
ncbi:MAG: SRPBCC family protein [Bacteroidota bacterium]|nr:SRPBCC family protein [Bacteroidota bacterium]